MRLSLRDGLLPRAGLRLRLLFLPSELLQPIRLLLLLLLGGLGDLLERRPLAPPRKLLGRLELVEVDERDARERHGGDAERVLETSGEDDVGELVVLVLVILPFLLLVGVLLLLLPVFFGVFLGDDGLFGHDDIFFNGRGGLLHRLLRLRLGALHRLRGVLSRLDRVEELGELLRHGGGVRVRVVGDEPRL